MTDPQHGRAISLLSATVIVLLALVSVLSAVAIVESYHAHQPTAPPDAAQKGSKTERVTLDQQYETAVHESGHVVIGQAYLPERPLIRMWLYTERPADTEYLGMTEPGTAAVSYPSGAWERGIALFFLGGRTAEQLFFGSMPPTADEDRDVAGEAVLDYCDKVGCDCPTASTVGGHCLLRDLLRVERQRLREETFRCLRRNKETVLELANRLFRKDPIEVKAPRSSSGGRRRTLEAAELKDFFAAHPLKRCDPPGDEP